MLHHHTHVQHVIRLSEVLNVLLTKHELLVVRSAYAIDGHPHRQPIEEVRADMAMPQLCNERCEVGRMADCAGDGVPGHALSGDHAVAVRVPYGQVHRLASELVEVEVLSSYAVDRVVVYEDLDGCVDGPEWQVGDTAQIR